MAVTNVHTIHQGTYNAIAYIINPNKTGDGRYVISNLCVSTAQGAAQQFRETRELAGTGRCRTEAQHIIQSFAPSEVTPERALLIGQELCKALFNDEYQYVLAVHIDHEHIHNHIVLNNVNFYTGKTFETEFNQGKIPERAWSKLRQVSDDLCRKHLLSVIESPEKSKGKSHYEWELDKQSLSWKAQLKQAIDEVIKVSEDFNDFLLKCAEYGILVDYNPEHKIDLKFMLAAQKERNPRARFTRAKTLGWFYESKQIARRIETYKYMTTHAPKARLIPTTAERFQQSQGLTNWADRENMKAASKALNEMNESNSTLEELESAAHRAFAEFMVMSTPQMELSDRIHKIEEQIPAIEKYHEFVAYHKKYTSLEGKAKTKYKSDFCYELDEYHKAYKKLIELFPDAHIPKLSKLKTELEKARTDYAQQSAERKALKKEADRLSRLARQKRDSQKTVQRYLQNEQAAKRKKNQLE
mgnify:CR=1 FL=1